MSQQRSLAGLRNADGWVLPSPLDHAFPVVALAKLPRVSTVQKYLP